MLSLNVDLPVTLLLQIGFYYMGGMPDHILKIPGIKKTSNENPRPMGLHGTIGPQGPMGPWGPIGPIGPAACGRGRPAGCQFSLCLYGGGPYLIGHCHI